MYLSAKSYSQRWELLAITIVLLMGCQTKKAEKAVSVTQSSDNTVIGNTVMEEQSHRYFVGSYAQNGPSVYFLEINEQTGALSQPKALAHTLNPSYLAWDKSQHTLFAVNEITQGGVSMFNWQQDQQTLTLTEQLQGLGDSACHISISPDGQLLAVANYMSGDIHLLRRSGQSLSLIDHVEHQGKGSHLRQEAPHVHWVNWSDDGRFLYAVDLGTDQITAYRIQGGQLTARKIAATLRAEDGPRHLLLHPDKALAYVINELSNTVTVFEQNRETGLLHEIQRIDTRSAQRHQHSQGAAIKLSADGRFLYTSNRGPNTITVFAVAEDGKLTRLQEQSTGGDWPRDFTLSADGRFVLVANVRSNSINLLKRNPQTGLLSATEQSVEVSQPTFVGLF